MAIRPLTITSVYWFLIVTSGCGTHKVYSATKSSTSGSVMNQHAEQRACERSGVDLTCRVPALDDNIDFRNYTSNIQRLIFYCNKKKYLPSRLLDGLFAPLGQTLKSIFIYDCFIIGISSNAFGGLERLTELYIIGETYPKITNSWLEIPTVSNSSQPSQTNLAFPSTTWYHDNLVLPEGVFSELHNLKNLHLTAMRLNTNIWHAIKHLRNLNYLDLRNNNITTIDMNTINNLQNLSSINLNANYLQVIQNGTFESLSHLRYLDLSGNRIRFIGTGAFKGLRALQTLWLSGNNIITIDNGTFWRLSQLDELDLSQNIISSVGTGTFSWLSQLVTLDMSQNNISGFGTGILQGLSHMRTLDLSQNIISSFGTGTFKGLSQMVTLDLSQNNISGVCTGTFKGLSQLITLDLSQNNISSVGTGTFKGLSLMRALNLSENKISTLEMDTSGGLSNLNYLCLAKNLVKILSPVTLSRLTSLRTLDLSCNLIETISKFPISLTSLNLRNNSIFGVDKNSFAGLQRLTHLDLSYNKIREYIQYHIPYTMRQWNVSSNELSVASLNLTSNLVFADFRKNKLKTLTINGLKHNLNAWRPAHIYLAGNGYPFRCTCNIKMLNNVSTFIYDRSTVAQYHSWNFTSLNCMSVSDNTRESEITEFSARKFVCNTTCYDKCTCYHWKYRGNNINIVDCLSAGLTVVPSNISVSCTFLDLSGNMFPSLTPDNFDSLSQLVELYLNSSNITEIKKGTFEELSNLRKIDLSNNGISILNSGIFIGLSKLLSLDLSFNSLHVVVESTFKCFDRLNNLDLAENELKTISTADIKSMYTIKSLKLSKNPWSCDCEFLQTFIPFTTENAKHIKDYIDIICFDSNKTEHYLFKIDLKEFCLHSKSKAEIVLGGIVGVFILGNICVFILFKNREFFKLWFFIKCGWKSASAETEDWNRPYDAFVSYSNADEAFVTSELIPRLEEPRQGRLGYKLCVHFRDFPVGGHIPETILGAVNNSRRVIMILSDNFLTSEWCNYEFQAAHHQLLTEWKNRIIMVLLHDLNTNLLDRQLKLYLSMRTYVKVGDPLLWDKIEYAMPERKSPTEDNLNGGNNDDQIDNVPAGGDENTFDDVQLIN